MQKISIALCAAIMLVFAQGGCLQRVKDADPATIQRTAKTAGHTAITLYFGLNQDQVKNAEKLAVAVSVIRTVLEKVPENGFLALKPTVEAEIKKKLSKPEQVILQIGAINLANTLLEELDRKAKRDGWFEKAERATAGITGFIQGADDALQQIVKRNTSP